MSAYPEAVRLVEMLPRDGFQRYDEFVPTDQKVALIDKLSRTGVEEIEISSFTHPEAVPALRDADEVARRIDRLPGVSYRALVPNAVGMERAIAADVDKVNALVTVSERYSARNQGMSVDAILEEIDSIVELAADTGITVEAGIGTSFYCPYEGKISMAATLAVVDRVVAAGPRRRAPPARHQWDEPRQHRRRDALWRRSVRRLALRARWWGRAAGGARGGWQHPHGGSRSAARSDGDRDRRRVRLCRGGRRPGRSRARVGHPATC